MNKDKQHQSEPERLILQEDREPFNDVIDHFDKINGFRVPKRIGQYPKYLRKWVRIKNIALITLLLIGIIFWILFGFR